MIASPNDKRKIEHYDIVSEFNEVYLGASIEEMLESGFLLYGSPFNRIERDKNGGLIYSLCQAMIKYEA